MRASGINIYIHFSMTYPDLNIDCYSISLFNDLKVDLNGK